MLNFANGTRIGRRVLIEPTALEQFIASARQS